MADSSRNGATEFVREIELSGHILDSGVFGRVLEIIMDNEFARYTIDNFAVGKTATEPSTARLRIEADTGEHLDDLLDKLRDIGAAVADDTDAEVEPAPAAGVLPDDFYATTNLDTEVRIAGRWHDVRLPEMDCAIVIAEGGATTVAPSDVQAGDAVVVGSEGVRVKALQRPRRKQVFEFMSSAVSSEKPKESLIAEIARELQATREAGKRVLLVGGPAIVHTGAGKYLERLIANGYVDALFAGNALAVHDIESQFFGTSLGVNLADAFPVEEGHVHHLRTVNRIRAAGGIANAIASGRLSSGIMYEAYSKGIPVVLAGSIRDDGPLPDVITDVVDAQRAMRRYVPEIGMALMVCTLLHSIAVGNLLPSSCKVICVDINPASVTKLTDRGSTQTIGLVMDADSFLRELWHALSPAGERVRRADNLEMDRSRALAVVAAFVAVVCAVGWWSLRQQSGIGPLNNPTDFVAFYCGGKVAARGADPYRAEPLRSCERAAFAESRVPMVPGLVVPAPLPGYDLAFFAPFSLVSFRLAALLWAAGIFASVGLSVWLLAALTGFRPWLVFASLAASDLYASLVPGQLVPYVVCALVACGYALARGRPRLAALCACAMLAEPHLGLPVVLALAVWEPRARGVLACGVAVLGALSLAFLGGPHNLEYVASVLPGQAATEGLEFTRQYGLSAALAALGVGARAATSAGSLSYLVMLATAVATARRAARAFDAPALVAFVPAALVLFGGAYLHIAQMAAAIPFALVASAREGPLRRYAVGAAFCLAVPWQTVATSPEIASLFPARGYIDPKPLLARVSDGSRFAQDAWSAWIATTIDRDHRTPFEVLLFKLPTWAALGILVAIVLREVRKSEPILGTRASTRK